MPFFSERSPLTSPEKDQHSAPHALACSLRRFCPTCLIPTRHHVPDICWPSGRSDRGLHTRLCDWTPGTAIGDGGAPEPYLLSSLRLLPTSWSSCWLCRSSSQTSLCSRSFSPFTQAYSRCRSSRFAAFLERDSRNFSFSFCLSANTKKRH